MRSVDLQILKRHLDEYVRLASQGETVLVLDRDQPVAELVPPRAISDAQAKRSDAEIMADLVRRGLATPRRRERGSAMPPRIPIMPLSQLLEELDRDREDRC